jgi:hypothetical protein
VFIIELGWLGVDRLALRTLMRRETEGHGGVFIAESNLSSSHPFTPHRGPTPPRLRITHSDVMIHSRPQG